MGEVPWQQCLATTPRETSPALPLPAPPVRLATPAPLERLGPPFPRPSGGVTRRLPLTSVTSSPLSALLFRQKSSAFPLKSADSRLRPSMLRHHLRPLSFSSVTPLVSRLLVTFSWAPTNPSTSLPPSPLPLFPPPSPLPPPA